MRPVIAIALAAMLAACAAPSSTEPTAAATTASARASESAPTTAEAAAPRRLVVYSGRTENLIGPIIESFESETGIDVDVRWGNTSEIALTLMEEGARTPADVFLAQEPAALAVVDAMLSPLPHTVLDRAPEALRAADGHWVGVTGRSRVVVYNTENVAEEDLPTDVSGYTAPEWRGRVGWAPSNASFQAMVTAMRGLWGEAKTREWLEGMIANDVKTFDSNAPIVAAVGSGELDAGLVNHYYLQRFLEEEGPDFPARNHFEGGHGPGALLLVSAAGVLESAENRSAAEEFVAFLLSNEVQRRFVTDTSEYAVVSGIEGPPGLPPLAQLEEGNLPPAELADLEGTIALLRDVGALP